MSFICPFPLAYGIETDHKTVWTFEQGNCVLRCPTVTYTQNEWNLVGNEAELLFSLSMVGTCVIFVYQLYTSKLKAEFLPRIMFLLGFFLVSLVLVIFLYSNGSNQNKIICDEQSAFIEREPLCMLQATSTIFFIIWIEMWSFFMAYENYLFICSALEQSSNHGKNNKKYMVLSIFVCSVCTLIPVLAGNIGFDYQANLPICLFLVSDNRNYLWGTLVAPFAFFAVLCLVYTLKSIYKIQSIFVLSEQYLARQTVVSESISEESISSQIRMGSVRNTIATPMHNTSNDGYGDDRATDDRTMEYTRGGGQREPVYEYKEPTRGSRVSWRQTLWAQVKRTWKYNGRQMIFFSTFCLCTLAIVPVIVYSYGTQFDYYVDGTEDFIECLIVSAAGNQALSQEEVDQMAEKDCGSVPSVRPDQALILTIICWFAAYGAIPIFIYGFASDRFQTMIVQARAHMNFNSCTKYCCKSKEGDSSTSVTLPPIRSGIDSEFH